MSAINTYFSQKDNLQEVILDNLDRAEHSVHVAVAWFTDVVLFKKLLHIQGKGVKVQLIITNHQFNDESHNDYVLIEQNGGVFIEVGGNYTTMHHKFCIIDHKTVLQGSFNWTKKANESNNETLMVIKEDNHSVNEFTEEFERLKRLAGMEIEIHQLEISKALKYFTLIKSFIDLGKTNELNPYLHEIKHVEELKSAVDFLFNGEYEKAVVEMDFLAKQFTSVTNFIDLEREEIIFKIRIISEKIKQVEIEKTEIEEQVDHFNRRYILELNPLLASIIQLKKKIYEKLKQHGIVNEEFEKLKDEYERVQEELQNEEEKNVPDLTEADQMDMKKRYHEASTLCHPDSPKCVIKDKKAAEDLFSALSQAYKAKNFAKVKEIHDDLKLGTYKPENLTNDEMASLKKRLASLEYKYERVMNSLKLIKTTDPYLTIKGLEDWDEFFNVQKILLKNQKEELELKYVQS